MRESKKSLRKALQSAKDQRDEARESRRKLSVEYYRFRNNLATVHPEVFTQYTTVKHYPSEDIEAVDFDKFARDIERVATEIHEREKLTETYTRVYGPLIDEEI